MKSAMSQPLGQPSHPHRQSHSESLSNTFQSFVAWAEKAETKKIKIRIKHTRKSSAWHLMQSLCEDTTDSLNGFAKSARASIVRSVHAKA